MWIKYFKPYLLATQWSPSWVSCLFDCPSGPKRMLTIIHQQKWYFWPLPTNACCMCMKHQCKVRLLTKHQREHTVINDGNTFNNVAGDVHSEHTYITQRNFKPRLNIQQLSPKQVSARAEGDWGIPQTTATPSFITLYEEGHEWLALYLGKT